MILDSLSARDEIAVREAAVGEITSEDRNARSLFESCNAVSGPDHDEFTMEMIFTGFAVEYLFPAQPDVGDDQRESVYG